MFVSNPARRCETASADGVEKVRTGARAQPRARVNKVTGVRGTGVTEAEADQPGAAVKEVGARGGRDPKPGRINDRLGQPARQEIQIASGRPVGQAVIDTAIGKPATIKDVPLHHERERQG